MQIRLEDIRPERATFKLQVTGKEYALRPVSLNDELWMQKTFGEEIQKIFTECRWNEIFRIVFHQLEDQADFTKKTVKIVNEDGDEAEAQLGGFRLLLTMVSGHDEKFEVLKALLATIGVSRPMLDKLVEGEMSVQAQKKSETSSTGPESSTDSEPSTDGAPISSSA